MLDTNNFDIMLDIRTELREIKRILIKMHKPKEDKGKLDFEDI